MAQHYGAITKLAGHAPVGVRLVYCRMAAESRNLQWDMFSKHGIAHADLMECSARDREDNQLALDPF